MPAFDQTGPQGMGPATGRGLGSCFGLGHQRYLHSRGRGGRFCWRKPPTKEEKLEMLNSYKEDLKKETEEVDKELAGLNNQE